MSREPGGGRMGLSEIIEPCTMQATQQLMRLIQKSCHATNRRRSVGQFHDHPDSFELSLNVPSIPHGLAFTVDWPLISTSTKDS
jgi:hypothetical protein